MAAGLTSLSNATPSHAGPVRPLCLTAFSFAAAIAAARYLLPFGTALYACLASLACALLFLVLLLVLTYRKYLKTVLLAALALSAGFAWRWSYDRLFVLPATDWDRQTVSARAEALEYARETAYGAQLVARLTIPGGGRYKTILYLNEKTEIYPGDQLSLSVICTAPEPGQQDDALAFNRPKGIVLRAIQDGEDISVTRPAHMPALHQPALFAETVRQKLNSALSPRQAALARGILIGDTSDLSEGFRDALSNTGMSHTVAVSGLHVSFLVGAIVLLAGNRKRAFWLGVPVVFLFAAVAGFPASAVRAGIMQTCLLLSYVLGREEDSLTALSLSLFILVALNPYAVADVGLQLSFAATLGIILFAGRLRDALADIWLFRRWPDDRLPRLRDYICSTLAVSFSVLIFSAPLVAVYFQTLSLISPLANLMTLWLTSFMFLGSLSLVGISLLWEPAAALVAAVVEPILALFEWIVTVLSRVPFAALQLQSPFFAYWGLLIYVLLWLYILWPPRTGEKRRPLLPLGLGLATLVLSTALSWARPAALEIVVLNVGQGQSILLITHDKTAVIDCGGNIAHVANLVVDTLKSKGRAQIDLLALTHTHDDHAGAVEDLMELIEIKRVALPASESEDALRERIYLLAGLKHIPITEIDQAVAWPLGEALLTLYPPLGQFGENELCMSMLASVGDFSLLLTGDMSQSLERALIRLYDLPDIDVLIAGHHGSRYAAANRFLDAVTPEIAIISVGRNNYGHPSNETLERLWQRGIVTCRTDNQGSVRILVSP